MWETQTLSASHARDNWTFHLYNEVNKLFSNRCFTMQVWISRQNSSFIKNTRHCQHYWSQQCSGSESHMNLVLKWPSLPKIVHCSVVAAPTSIGEVMGSNPIGDSKFFFFFFFLPFFFLFLFFVFARDKSTIHPDNYSRCEVGYARNISFSVHLKRIFLKLLHQLTHGPGWKWNNAIL